MQKKIAILSIIIPILGLLSEYLMLINDNFNITLFFLHDYLAFFRLGFFDEQQIFGTDDYVNYINVPFYLLFLMAGVIYYFNSKEVRLVRFMFSLLFITSSLMLTSWFLSFLLYPLERVFKMGWYWPIVGILWITIQLIIYYKVLTYFNKITEPAIIQKQYGDYTSNILVEATIWQRIFNYIFDYVTLLLVFSPVLYSYMRIGPVMETLRTVESIFGENIIVWFIIVVCRIIYFFTFESIFQASPAKFLNGTKVVDEDSNKPATVKIFVRTISRFVPLEPFTFLFGRGWHDSWSATYVIQEKRKGVKGGLYFWCIPVIALLLLGLYKGAHWYEEYKLYSEAKGVFDMKAESINVRLDNISRNDVLVIKASGGNNIKYIMAEEVSPNEVTFTVLEMPPATDNNYIIESLLGSVPQKDMEQFYLKTKDTLKRVSISRSLLKKANVPFSESQDNSYDRTVHGGVDLLNDGVKYCIERTETFFAPNIKVFEDVYTRNSHTFFSIYNEGWTAEITEISNNTDDGAQWRVLNTVLRAPKVNSETVRSNKEVDEVDITLKIKDTLNKPQVYRIFGGKSSKYSRQRLMIQRIK